VAALVAALQAADGQGDRRARAGLDVALGSGLLGFVANGANQADPFGPASAHNSPGDVVIAIRLSWPQFAGCAV